MDRMDLVVALRSFRRSLAFTLLAAVILALGIGANTAIFSVVNAVVLKPLAYKQPDRIVALTAGKASGAHDGLLSGPDYLDLARQVPSFAYASYFDTDKTGVAVNGSSDYLALAMVGAQFFNTIGVDSAEGRTLAPDDWKTGMPSTVLVSQSFWNRHFGHVPFDTGRVIRVRTLALEIVGVMPAGFAFPDQTEIWIPFQLESLERSAGNYRAVARLKPDATLTQAQTAAHTLALRLQKAYRASNAETDFFVTQLQSFSVRSMRTTLAVLLGAVSLVLLIACANVSSLVLARAHARTQEMAIRSALGASRWRIVRLCMMESGLLAAAGCVGGIVLAQASLNVLIALAPQYVPRLAETTIDTRVLLYSVLLAALASVLFGLAPAWHASRTDANEALRQGGARGIIGGRAGLWHRVFVGTQVALSVVLLIAAGLLLKSFAALAVSDLGFHKEKLLLAEMSAPALNAADERRLGDQFFRPFVDRLRESPQIGKAALVFGLPGDTSLRSWGSYVVSGQTLQQFASGMNLPQTDFSGISPEFLETMGIPLIAGRAFNEGDGAGAPLVGIINEAMARQSFGRRNPIGLQVSCGWDQITYQHWMTIVGVVADVRQGGPGKPASPVLYMPLTQHPKSNVWAVIRPSAQFTDAQAAVMQTAHQLNADVSVRVSTIESFLSSTIASPRFLSTLITCFAGLALVLAAAGTYAVVAYSVGLRTGEIGLRFALGATRLTILQMIIGGSMKVIGSGLLIGLVASLATTRLLRAALYQVTPLDLPVYFGVTLLLMLATLVASYLPAQRASRVEPSVTLREN